MKALVLAPCLALLIGMVGCTKKNYYTNPGTTFLATAQTSDWVLDTSYNSYTLNISTPELKDDNTTKSDALVVAISYPDANGNNTVFETIPEVYNGISYSYTYNSGNITIYAQSADGTTPVPPDSPVTIKVSIIPSDLENG
jgi:hypothetical protein